MPQPQAPARQAAPNGGISAAAIAAAAAAAVADGTAGRGAAFQPSGGQAEAPGYEAVPDEVYDAYDDSYDEVPLEPSPEGAAVAALSGASKQPIPSPDAGSKAPGASAASVPDAGSVPPWEAAEAPGEPKEAPAAQVQGDGGASQAGAADPVASDLSQLLSAGFGGYVKVTWES